ncbi:MAG: helix-turn-helix domain-containing protein [Anaerolineaceae bacterium]|nr:helix-turn-helix domain-containing protein [Anaerolineaceae bacterium]
MHALAENLPNFAMDEETPAPPPGVLLADYFESQPGYTTRRAAGTRDWLISLTVGGAGRYRLEGNEVMAQAGVVVLLAPGTPHDYATLGDREPWCFYWAHFLPRAQWLAWLKLPQVRPGLAVITMNSDEILKQIVAAFQRVVNERAERRPFQEDLAQNALEEVIIRLAQEAYHPAERFVDPRAGQIQEYLEQHYTRPVSLGEIAGLVSLSPWRVSHLYKNQTGQTITEALTQLRLRQAARLLAYTSRTMLEISADVGFESAYYFSRLFKKVYGKSPLAYRKDKREG